MSDVKWIKIVTDIFDDEKILLIENMPESDVIIVIWFKLLCLAGKNNNSGVFMMNDKIPYTDEMLATIFRRPLNTVRLALKIFQQYGMIEVIENVITIPNWSKHQNLDKLEQRNNYMREYMKNYREKQKLIASKTNSKVNNKLNSKVNVSALEEEGEEDKEEDKEEDNIRVYWDKIISAWNNLQQPIKPIRTITSKRKSKIKTRITNLKITQEDVIVAINNINNSKFLQGQNNKNWIIDFDWLFKNDDNFNKVYEGKYTDKEKQYGSYRENNETSTSDNYDFSKYGG